MVQTDVNHNAEDDSVEMRPVRTLASIAFQLNSVERAYSLTYPRRQHSFIKRASSMNNVSDRTFEPATSSSRVFRDHRKQFSGSNANLKVMKSSRLFARKHDGLSQLHRGVFHPLSMKRCAWDLVMILPLLFVAWTVPFRLAFDVPSHWGWFLFDRILDFFFIVDIGINFCTGYQKGDVVIMDRTAIAIHYTRTWFAIDLLSAIPFDLVLDGFIGESSNMLKMLKLLRMVKLFRLFRLSRILGRLRNKFSAHTKLIRFIMLTVGIVVLGHYCACIFYALANAERGKGAGNWLDEIGLQTYSFFEVYVVSLYFAVATISTVGFGDIATVTTHEKIGNIVVMVIGASFHAYMITQLIDFIIGRNERRRQFRIKMDRVNAYLKFRKLSKDLTDRIRVYFQLSHHMAIPELETEKSILNELSPLLYSRLAAVVNSQLESSSVLYEGGDALFNMAVHLALEKGVVPPGEIILARGESITKLYVIMFGECAAVNELGEVIETFKQGMYFGAECIQSCEDILAYTVKSLTWVEIRVLSRASLYTLLKITPANPNEALKSLHLTGVQLDDYCRVKNLPQKPLWLLVNEHQSSIQSQVLQNFTFTRPLHSNQIAPSNIDVAALQDNILCLDFDQLRQVILLLASNSNTDK